jgi:hypothetical protein
MKFKPQSQATRKNDAAYLKEQKALLTIAQAQPGDFTHGYLCMYA